MVPEVAVLWPRDEVFVSVRAAASDSLTDARAVKASVLSALSSEFGAVGGKLHVDLVAWDAASRMALLRTERGGLARLRSALARDVCPLRVLAARSSLIGLARARTGLQTGMPEPSEAAVAAEVARAAKRRRS